MKVLYLVFALYCHYVIFINLAFVDLHSVILLCLTLPTITAAAFEFVDLILGGPTHYLGSYEGFVSSKCCAGVPEI